MLWKLTRDEVIAKYSPTPDPLWTPEVEARFFASLPAASPPVPLMGGMKAALVREFATETLHPVRVSCSYVATLGMILSRFADADDEGAECLISQRDQRFGTPRTIRTIQTQMESVGLLIRLKRSQGKGFVGDVFIYAPHAPFRNRRATAVYLEESYRGSEGQAEYINPPSNLSPDLISF